MVSSPNSRQSGGGVVERKSYGVLRPVVDVPNLVQVQLTSFRWFQEEGLKELFADISPIQDFTGTRLDLRFLSYEFRRPQWSEAECRLRNLTYSAPLYVRAQLLIKETGEIKEQEIFFGDFPIMTPKGTFITSGAERVVISQLLRSPGVYLTIDEDAATGRQLCMGKLIPDRGAWLEFETSNKEVLSVKVDGRRKIPVTTLFRALGFGTDDELKRLFDTEAELKYIQATMDRDLLVRNTQDALLDIYKRLRPGDPASPENSRNLINNLFFNARRYDLGKVGRYKLNKRLQLWRDLCQPLLAGMEAVSLPEDSAQLLASLKKAVERNDSSVTDLIKELLSSLETAVLDEAKNLKLPSDVQDVVESLRELAGNLEEEATDLWRKLADMPKGKAEWESPALLVSLRGVVRRLSSRVLTAQDLVDIVRRMIRVNTGEDTPDDIDHLGNRRVRTVGELIQNQFRIGLLRLERVVKERMSIIAPDQVTPSVLVNTRPVVAAMREFFGGSQLSQFMDQTNPLAELTHKRRLSTMGPGGLSRERAGFDVRDVHYSHYGRICPIETPEGPNIGLIGSLATYSRINEYGFIETPYRKVVKEVNNTPEELVGRTLAETLRYANNRPIAEAGTVVDQEIAKKISGLTKRLVKVVPFVSGHIDFLSADKEDEYTVAQAKSRLNERGEFMDDEVETRSGQEYPKKAPSAVDYMDVSPKQVFSVAASLIPFFEHNDANRALMGSNMQRQAVPLLRPEAPLVATGMEREVARYSGQVVFAEEDGKVESVTGSEIRISGRKDPYRLTKFTRTNQGTCINQRPIVERGQMVTAGTVLADSSATEKGELALGQNVLCAFMSWEGYNFEDAIILSEALVRDDKFTSIHLEKYEMEARDTKLGAEEITRDIPNVGEESLRDLDEYGIIRVGAEVRPGDILVGKITPKGETELTAEERLLRAIFGDKAHEVKDNSLRVPHGEWGKVIDVRIFSHKNHDELPAGVNQLVQVWVAQRRKISVGDKMAGRHGNKGVVGRILPVSDMPVLPDGRPVDIVLNPIGVPSRMNIGQVFETHLGWAAMNLGFKVLSPIFDGADDMDVQDALARAWIVYRSTQGPNGATGNGQGPKLEDAKAWLTGQGLDVDAVFDESRQGEARRVCLRIWLKDVGIKSSLSDEQVEEEVEKLRKQSRLSPPVHGKIQLRDGRTGESFDQPVTVGSIYILKLIHLAEDKIHARSTGPYSLITQQPLGGKAQFGGQRFGEMEVWALEAYGAAHILQELLTVKSDDVMGRAKTYEAIVKGDDIVQPGVPESFKVLVKELQSLCLSVEVLNEEEEKVDLMKETEGEEYPRLGLEHEFTTGAD
ncbi:MAG: DNA-directed RNA polymerase subunit beta [Dehalococcoidia bacterium]|nr:DNA-directed RNA polymerase subunit beta [Dehalococcoidia bacterium]